MDPCHITPESVHDAFRELRSTQASNNPEQSRRIVALADAMTKLNLASKVLDTPSVLVAGIQGPESLVFVVLSLGFLAGMNLATKQLEIEKLERMMQP